MDKKEALAVLAKYLPPPVLSEFMQFWWQSGLEQQAMDGAPARAHKRMTYAEAQRRRLCPYCGEPGDPAPFDLDVDPDFERFTCPNEHGFFVERKRA